MTVPAWVEPWLPWLTVLGSVSVVLAIIGTVLLPWWLVALPSDAFARPPDRGPVRTALRGVLGGLLVLAGIAMLVLPGQGLLSIVLGLWLMDLPVMRRSVQRALSHRAVRPVVDRWRRGAGREPFVWPAADRDGRSA